MPEAVCDDAYSGMLAFTTRRENTEFNLRNSLSTPKLKGGAGDARFTGGSTRTLKLVLDRIAGVSTTAVCPRGMEDEVDSLSRASSAVVD
jgi:hypothetical protein